MEPPVVALHQLAQHLLDWHPARQRVRMPAVGAEGEVAGAHGGGETGRNRLLAQRQMARSLHQVLQEEIERALLALADLDLNPVHGEALLLSDVVVDPPPGSVRGADRFLRHARFL